uniref:Protein of unassigned function n=1 Tax=Methylobacterium oryzae CBMB20 TaxID=693986 RepID=A0A088B2Z2_9HYPH|nr:protein of unassigned function [Methylobacterium oryzae CBMB20]
MQQALQLERARCFSIMNSFDPGTKVLEVFRGVVPPRHFVSRT